MAAPTRVWLFLFLNRPSFGRKPCIIAGFVLLSMMYMVFKNCPLGLDFDLNLCQVLGAKLKSTGCEMRRESMI